MNTLMKLYLLHEGRTQRVWDMRPGQSYLVGGSTSNDIVIDRRLCHWDALCEVEAQPGRLVVTAVFDGPSIEGPKGAAQLVALRNFETAGVGSLRLGAVEQPLAFDWSEGESGQELLPTAADLGVVPAEKKLLVFELLDGKGGRLYQVKHGFLLGRVKTDNGIRFQNLAVSARHALVEERRDGFYLIDDSTHGTWINGVHYPKGVPVKLEKGMKIQLSPGGLVPLIEVHEAADLVRGRSGSPIVGESPATLAIVTRVRQMCTAGGRRRFLVLGAPGTGKELVGDEVARWVNARKEKVVCDCSTLPPTIIESELFGTVLGAFTDAVDRPGLVEAAAGGVLYLDEIGDMPLALQPKLLRLLEKGDFHRAGETKLRTADCVVVAATNRDLEAMVLAGTFRKDLHDRLKMGTVVHLQPLAERKQDILPIAASYLARREGRSHPSLSREAAYALVDHDWPGNVRELLGVVEVAAARTDGAEIEAATIREVIAEQRGPAGNAASPREALPRNVPERLRALERQLVEEGFNLYGRRWHTAAKKLGYAPSTFKRRVIEFGLLTREEADRQEKEGD